jgi:bacterioferritin
VSSKDKKGDVADRPFLSDIQELRRRARVHIGHGAITPGYQADRRTVIRLLNEALDMASGIHATAVAEEFFEHSKEEQSHADLIAERITQLGREPDFDAAGLLTRSHSEYVAGLSPAEMSREDLVAERVAIESYRDMIRSFGNNDPTSRRVMETVLANDEEHAGELKILLEALGSEGEPA